MDHTCHQCGQEIEAGTPFCRHCGAPQIRVPSTEEPAPAPVSPSAPDEAQPPAAPVAVSPTLQNRPEPIRWSDAFPAALSVGLILAVCVIPYIGYFLGVIAAGIFAVALYRQRVPDVPLTPANGARVGAICGLFGFIGLSGIAAIGLLLIRGSTKFREEMQQAMQQAAANNPDPKVKEIMTSPAGLAMLITVGMVFFLAGFVALGSVGGAIGAWIFSPKKDPPQN